MGAVGTTKLTQPFITRLGYVNGSGTVQFGSERPPENLSIPVPVSVPGATLSPFLCKPFVETSSKATYVPSLAVISPSATAAEVVTSTILDTSLSTHSKT